MILNIKSKNIVETAENFLRTQSYDIGHDLDHHYAVLKIASDITDHLDETVDREALKIAVMWHDVVSDSTVKDKEEIKIQTAEYLKNLLLDNEVEHNKVEEIFLAVRYHSYEDTPRNTIGKILYDADKLTTFDLNRWKKL